VAICIALGNAPDRDVGDQVHFSEFTSTSEEILQSELHDSWILRRRYLAENGLLNVVGSLRRTLLETLNASARNSTCVYEP
jgi:hypothetical protein